MSPEITRTHSARRSTALSGYTTIPYVIAYANELIEDPIQFEHHASEMRLAYYEHRRSDWVHGILRARVRDLRDKPDRRGPERMRKLNTRRQWRCMDKLLCQVCGDSATDPETGLIPWLLTKTVFDTTGEDSGRTNAPPTCSSCVTKALGECPMLQGNATLHTVTSVTSVGVLADMYEPEFLSQRPALSRHNVFITWDAHRYHRSAVATSQVVELHGMSTVTLAGPWELMSDSGTAEPLKFGSS